MMSKARGIIPVFLAVVLLLCASCRAMSDAAYANERDPTPKHTARPSSSPAASPSVYTLPSVTHNSTNGSTLTGENGLSPDWEDWGDGDDSYWGLLPPPEISEADLQTFNPDRIVDYLASCPYVYHEYTIIGAERLKGRLLITVWDYIYSEWPTDVFQYLKSKFSLSDEEILSLPLFSGFYIDDGWVTSDEGDIFSIGTLVYEDVLVADNASIRLLNTDTYEYYEVTTQEFADILLGEANINDNLSMFFFHFEYSDNQITDMWQDQEYEPDYEEYEEEGD